MNFKNSKGLDKPLTANQITSLHLYELALAVPFNPLSRQYSLLFHKFNNEKSINLPANPTITQRFCVNCGGVLVHGITLSVRIKYHNKKKKKVNSIKDTNDDNLLKSRRYLQFKCLHCKHITKDKTLIEYNPKQEQDSKTKSSLDIPIIKSISPSPVATSKSQSPNGFKAQWTPNNNNQVKANIPKEKSNDTNTNSKSKERSKKRKQNNLSNLLQQKKQQKLNESKGIGSLNLSEFLK
ncbi:uncharacterized protein RJT21DRAFT_5179 [Scheffersomyces amazonensis]|uniref:uncharacterized protein n=1 Tax=Scheffersomyces amazonensis TaxID=1078765 RepID=UPI00315C5677